MALTPILRPVDRARGARLMLSWVQGDELAASNVLREADADPIGVSGLVFTLAQTACDLAITVAPNDFGDQLRRAVLEFVIADEQPPPDAARPRG